jgi:hypothetical protein
MTRAPLALVNWPAKPLNCYNISCNLSPQTQLPCRGFLHSVNPLPLFIFFSPRLRALGGPERITQVVQSGLD